MKTAGRMFNTTAVKDVWGRPVLLFKNTFALNQVRASSHGACMHGPGCMVLAWVDLMLQAHGVGWFMLQKYIYVNLVGCHFA